MALRPKTTHGTITHEGVHALDIKTLTSVKAFIEEVGKTRSPADAVKVGRLWLSAQNATNPMNEFDNSLINNKLHHKLFTGIVEKTAVDGQFNAYKNSNFFGKLRLGNPLAREGGYLEDWDQFLNYSKGWSTRDRLDFIQGLSTSKNLSSTIQNRYSSWVRRLQNEGSKDLSGSVMKITDNFYDQELPGNVMKITDGYHKGGKVGHKHYNPRMASAYKAPYSGPSISALTPAKAAASAKAMNKLYGKNPDYYKNKNGEWTKKGPSNWETFTTGSNWKGLFDGSGTGPVYEKGKKGVLNLLTGSNSYNRYNSGKPMAKGEWISAAINLALARIAGPQGSALGRTMLEQVGITKGIPGLGSLLQKGSLPFLGATGSKFAANLGTAAAIGAGKPFLEGKFSTAFSDLKPKINITADEVDLLSKVIKENWIEHQGRRVPTYTGGPFKRDTVVYQGAKDDFSELASSGRVNHVIPTTPEGILEYLLTVRPGDKKFIAMRDAWESKDLGASEIQFLTGMIASSAFGPKTFSMRSLVSELPKEYLDLIKSKDLPLGTQHASQQVDQLPQETLDQILVLKKSIEDRSIRINEFRAGLPKINGAMSSDLGLLPRTETKGLTTFISSMLGDKTAKQTVDKKMSLYGPYLSKIVKTYADDFAESARYRGTDTDIDLSQVPMIRELNFGIQYDKNGNIVSPNAGMHIKEALKRGDHTDDRSRVTEHWSIWDAVRSGVFHMGSTWKESDTTIVTTLKNLLKTSEFESISSFDAWRTAAFGKMHKVLRNDASVITAFRTKKDYIKALKDRGLYKDGDPLELMTQSPETKEVLYLKKQKYTDAELDKIVKYFEEERHNVPEMKKVPLSARDAYERERGEGVFEDSGWGGYYPQKYSADRALKMMAILKAQKQIGINRPYSQMQAGENQTINPASVNAISNVTGTAQHGLHSGTPFSNTEQFGDGSNPFLTLLQAGGAKSKDGALAAILMHGNFGKFSSEAYPAHYSLNVDQRINKLIEEWARSSVAYKHKDTKIKPMSLDALNVLIQKIKKEDGERDHLAKGGYVSKYRSGGYVNPSYSANMSVPQFKDGINMVPADMLAMIHKNEAIIPADMNPFNPNANNATMAPAVYNISMTNNAAEGMDINAFSDIATRKILAEIKRLDVQRASMNGIGRGY
jgi:hypothetical protein